MSFTCLNCRVVFKDRDNQRNHYKTDWHRYNLKRQVVELPPVTAEEFNVRVLQQRGALAEAEKDHSQFCLVCRKHFSNKNSYENHLTSKKHKIKSENVNSEEAVINDEKISIKMVEKVTETIEDEEEEMETDSEVEEVSSDEWNESNENNPINKNNCLFCDRHSNNLVKNLCHMTEAHSFFIPDIEYCVNLRGLLLYLGAKITEGFMCLWCNEKGKKFASVFAVRKHMIDKGHCKMLHEDETLAEFVDYYDYSSSYPDHGNEDGDDDEEINIETIDGSEFQLVLPSGSVIGHRSLMRYYKQNLNPNRSLVLKSKIKQVLSNYTNFGYLPIKNEVARRKARDIQYMKRKQQKFSQQVGCKANKLQKHFRQQVNF